MASEPASVSGGRHRTFAVTVLAIIAVIAGIWNVMDTLRYLGLIPVVEVMGLHSALTLAAAVLELLSD